MSPEQTAFVFRGQDATIHLHEDKNLVDSFANAREVFEEASDVLGFDMQYLCFKGERAALASSEKAQVALATSDFAYFAVLTNHFKQNFDQFYGHSVGQYTALVAAKSIDFPTILKLLLFRGKTMDQHSDGKFHMVAITGLEEQQIAEVCLVSRGQISVMNAGKRFVITVPVPTPVDIEEVAKSIVSNARVSILPIEVPSHCQYAQDISEEMRKMLLPVKINKPINPIVANSSAKYIQTADEVRTELVNHIIRPVLFAQGLEFMFENGVAALTTSGANGGFAKLVNINARESDHPDVFATTAKEKIKQLQAASNRLL